MITRVDSKRVFVFYAFVGVVMQFDRQTAASERDVCDDVACGTLSSSLDIRVPIIQFTLIPDYAL